MSWFPSPSPRAIKSSLTFSSCSFIFVKDSSFISPESASCLSITKFASILAAASLVKSVDTNLFKSSPHPGIVNVIVSSNTLIMTFLNIVLIFFSFM